MATRSLRRGEAALGDRAESYDPSLAVSGPAFPHNHFPPTLHVPMDRDGSLSVLPAAVHCD